MAYGITASGFSKKTLAIIKGEWEASFRQAFGNSVNLLPPSNMATIIGIASEREASVWDLAEETYNSRGASTSQGVNLDNAGELTANARIAAAPSKTFEQFLFGDVGTVVPTSLIVSVSGNSIAKFSPSAAVTLVAGVDEVQHLDFSLVPDAGNWTLTMPDGQTTATLAFGAAAAVVEAAIQALEGWGDVTVSGDYTAGFDVNFTGDSGLRPWDLITTTDTLTRSAGPITITATHDTDGEAQGTATMVALEDGPTIALAESLTVIETPITGLTKTSNGDDATMGRLIETDAEYRIRRVEELQKNSNATLEAIRIGIKNVEDVIQAIVYENITLTTDGNGVPGKTIHAYVDGGDSQDIADALWLLVGGGIATYGAVSKTVIDSQGLSQTVKFDRPTDKPVYTIVEVITDDSYPGNGDVLVLDAILEYAATLKIGDDVLVYPKLLPAIVDVVPGIIDITIKVGFSVTPTLSTNLSIAPSERATFASGNIAVSSS